MAKASSFEQVENIDIEDDGEEISVTKSKVNVSGTVQLTAGAIVYIPTPTTDPRGLFAFYTPLFSHQFLTVGGQIH
jgi:hypothetical protein